MTGAQSFASVEYLYYYLGGARDRSPRLDCCSMTGPSENDGGVTEFAMLDVIEAPVYVLEERSTRGSLDKPRAVHAPLIETKP